MSDWTLSADHSNGKVHINTRRFASVEVERYSYSLDIRAAEYLISQMQAALACARIYDRDRKRGRVEELKTKISDTKREADNLEAQLAKLEKEVMQQACQPAEVEAIINKLSKEHPDKWEQAKKTAALRGWFVGQVMKETGGKADPKALEARFKELMS